MEVEPIGSNDASTLAPWRLGPCPACHFNETWTIPLSFLIIGSDLLTKITCQLLLEFSINFIFQDESHEMAYRVKETKNVVRSRDGGRDVDVSKGTKGDSGGSRASKLLSTP